MTDISENDSHRKTDGQCDADDYDFEASAREYMRKEEAKWQAAHKVFSWIDPAPTWISAATWRTYVDDDDFLPDPQSPCDRIFRFSLIGGGQIRFTEEWRFWRPLPEREQELARMVYPRISVTAHVGDKVFKCSGYLDHTCCEMDAAAVVMSPGTPQEIADRAAATLRAVDGKPEKFFALLDSSKGCAICGRPLKDEVSKLVGVGPDCAKQHRIPHNMEAANQRLALRRKLLGEVRT